ncbi:MAG: nuclear transport factor 2 family protein [Acidimicrobiia bacterium]|nr:nuclear transport factor 2 family protein [Acidimicrobiia bacterium]
MISEDRLSNDTVRAVVGAINAGDREAFDTQFVDKPTMSDDGTERDFRDWTDREIFSSNGRIEVDNQSDEGRALIANYRNDTYGEMRTSWAFQIDDEGKVSHMDVGQA